MDRAELEKRLLEHVQAEQYQPVKLRVIAKQLKLADEQRSQLRVAARRLAKRGALIYSANHVVHPAEGAKASDGAKTTSAGKPAAETSPEETASKRKSSPKTISGVFRRTAAGNGFVRPSSSKVRGDRSQDIYIPRQKCGDAADGDVVAVRISHRKRGGDQRLAGEIVEILERDTHRFVGTYLPRDGVGYVQIDGRLFQEPVFVGDAESKAVQIGDKVVVEMVRFPSHVHEGEGVILEVLGARGTPGVDTLSIMREFELPENFPEEVIEFARGQAEKFDESNISNRDDFTAIPTITIDPKDARDFDDAISLERLENGHWRLAVHIADVAYFVPARSVLDSEARERATSVYLPDRVIPMLPEIISNHLASLQPERIRLVKTAIIEFTADGARVAVDLFNGIIKSDRRFTYEEVDSYIAVPGSWRGKVSEEVFALLGRMHTLAMILRRRRLLNGAIELTLPEIKVDLDEMGRVAGAHLVENTESHQIIEEFMLAANEAVADFLQEREVDFLHRVHDPPDPRRLDALTDFVRGLGIECEDLQDRFEVKRVLSEVQERPERHAVNYAVLRSMSKAVYSPEQQGHFALNSNNYCHFTSPIRRYPDLTVHRSVDAIVRGKRPHQDVDALVILGDHCSEREQRAESAERELIKIKLLGYLSKKVGLRLEAVITGVERFGLFAQGVKLPAEGLIGIQTLQDDHYRLDERGHCLVGYRSGNSYRLGDHVLVEVARVDVERRELDLRLVERLKHAPEPPRSKQQRTKMRKQATSKKTKKGDKKTSRRRRKSE